MPQDITIAAFVFGAVLLLIALLGGQFSVFGAQILGAAGRSARWAAGVGGAVLVIIGLFGNTIAIGQLLHNSVGSPENGQKLCSVFAPNLWRDSLIVPQNWNGQMCKDFKVKVGAWNYQLGCVFKDGAILGTVDDGPPERNCGW